MALVGTVTLLLVLFERPGNDTDESVKMPKWMANARDRAVENRRAFTVVGSICILAFLLMSVWYLLVRVPERKDGRRPGSRV